MSRTIIIGDVHGCIDELRMLVRKTRYEQGVDRLVFLGDLLDRGPDPVGCVQAAMTLGAEMVMGNHEEKALRWRAHEATRLATGKPNPMKAPPPERAAEWAALSEVELAWLRACPVTLPLGHNWVAVHAGLLPGIPVAMQPPDVVLRCRWVDVHGRFVGLQKGSLDKPAWAYDWNERWDGTENVVYGHAVHSFHGPNVRHRGPHGATTVGLDTGCVFGGHLSAMVLDDEGEFTFVHVPALREWFPYRGEHTE